MFPDGLRATPEPKEWPGSARLRVVLRALMGQALSGWIALVGVSVRACARS